MAGKRDIDAPARARERSRRNIAGGRKEGEVSEKSVYGGTECMDGSRREERKKGEFDVECVWGKMDPGVCFGCWEDLRCDAGGSREY